MQSISLPGTCPAALPFETDELLIFTQLAGSEAAAYITWRNTCYFHAGFYVYFLYQKKKKKKVYPACPFCDIHDSVDLLVFSLWLHLTPSLARMLQINIQEVCVTSLQSISSKILLKATRNQALSKQCLSKSFAYTNRKWTNLVSFFFSSSTISISLNSAAIFHWSNLLSDSEVPEI